ncbi:MAG: protein-tyrosine phosphatase family protein [Pseudomonadota bacterium]
MFNIHDLRLGSGRLGIAPLPGTTGAYEMDLRQMLAWRPDLVISMTTHTEMGEAGAADLGHDLAAQEVKWRHLPVVDFGTPDEHTQWAWPDLSHAARQVLRDGGRVLIHCRGGCGRSGMAALRLMVEMGEEADLALARLRTVRPCAVETDAQFVWAAQSERQL